ncbi:MAG: exo-alpha-sialidase [Phycisphaerales bacterium]|nr:exo-alpha-sialidase [Phycisphaerales bacterium]
MNLRMTFLCAGIAASAICAGSVRGQDQAADETASRDKTQPTGHVETPDDPYAAVPREDKPTSPAGLFSRDGFVSVQVNVNGSGENIVGDAANEPSIAYDPVVPDRLTIGWRQFDTITNNFRQAGWGYSNDGGRSWTFPGVIEPGIFRSDPVLDYDAEGGFYYNSLTASGYDFWCHVYRSDDGAATWDSGVYAYGGDKQWMTIDRTGGIGHGHIYAAWSPFYSSADGSFTRSTNGGDSYMYPISIPGDPMWGTLAVGPDGELYVGGVDWWAGEPYFAKSTNAQNAAVTPTFGLSGSVNLGGEVTMSAGPNPGGLLGQAWIACDLSDGPTRGNVYMLASVDPSGSDPLDVMFARSTNGGSTWSSPVRVNDVASGWQWFGTMSVAPNGRIDVIWADTRNDPGGYDSELYYAYSLDAGQTWSTNVAVSPSWDPHVGWPQQNKLGDYYDMISDSVGAHVAYAATLNGEQDVYYVRLGDYDCNNNGVGDADDLAAHTSLDCNDNGIPDECDIAAGRSEDENENGIPDECETGCPGDLDGDGDTDQADLGLLLSAYGLNDGGDLDGDGDTDQADLGLLLSDYGCVP